MRAAFWLSKQQYYEMSDLNFIAAADAGLT